MEVSSNFGCLYTTTTGPRSTRSELDVVVLPAWGDVDTWVGRVEAESPGQSHERADGLGDAAVLVRHPVGDSASLHVRLGSAWLQLNAVGDLPDRLTEG